ncbi:unnamed protein product [Tuber melanosporum]|uniref:(Perigord truffle) hypothetical protein n=1 Tax=Tuber melanosporum (strain Mel28) TaxID=656061 RepID=D5GKF4_TUBMM|nr:uncharacterized protein GSTUM_00009513001 [Tuber melanosporum]CAZ84997.1 unnamed protein product [Tuber melanosporum]
MRNPVLRLLPISRPQLSFSSMICICTPCHHHLGTSSSSFSTPLRGTAIPQKLQVLIHERTSTFDLLKEQADVADASSLGTKLVDEPRLRGNFHLWWSLLGFKRRVYSDTGVKDVWKGLRIRNIDLPVRGSHATLIWQIFLKTGFQDEDFLEEIWEYIKNLDSRNRRWAGAYQFIIGHFLVADGSRARIWHRRLYPRHAPSSWPGFVRSVLKQRVGGHIELREIHAVIERPAGLYGSIIPLLCSMGLFTEAMKWHRHCISFDDLPGNTATADRLIEWTTKYGSLQDMSMLMLSFIQMGVRVKESSLIALIISRPKKFEALGFILARANRVDRSAMGDRFWAVVLGQIQLGTPVLFQCMQTFGEGLNVGRRTVEALKKRVDCSKEKALSLLVEFGMNVQGVEMVPDAEPSVLVDRLVRQIGARGLSGMEELEFLLKEALDTRNWEMFDQALSLPSPSGPTAKVYDLILQSQLRRGTLGDAINLLDHMRKSSISISSASLRLLVKAVLPPRKRAKNPNTMPGFTNDNLIGLIGILTSLLRSGSTNIEPTLWREIFKRLGMKRRLSDLETLALGLVEWYHPARSTITRRRFSTSNFNLPEALTSHPDPQSAPEILPLSPPSPLRLLFPPQFIHAIIQWGFLTFRPHSPNLHKSIPPPPPPEVRQLPRKLSEFAPCVATFTWGIAFARDLKALGVHVDTRSVLRAVRTRLNILYNAPEANGRPVVLSGRRVNRMAVALNHLSLAEMVDITERTWGGSLWRRAGWERGGEGGREWERNMKKEVFSTGIPKRVVERLKRGARVRQMWGVMRLRAGRGRAGRSFVGRG